MRANSAWRKWPVNRVPGISFCIITGGRRPDRMEALLQSIARMGVPAYEILVCGDWHNDPRIDYAPKKEWAGNAEVCRMRNFNAHRARYATVIILDDDVEFFPDWWEKIKKHTGFDLAGCRGVDPHGERWWDYQRVERGNPIALPALLPYGERHPDAYISGYFMMMRWEVWNAVRFDESRRNYQHDDVDFCHRATSMGFSLATFPDAAVIHHVDPRGREASERARAQFIASHKLEGATDAELAAKYMMLKEYGKAIPLFKKLAAERGDFHSVYNLAFCCERAGARDEALFCYKKAAAATDEVEAARRAAAHFHAGEILRDAGTRSEAEAHFKSALEILPQHRKAARALAELADARTEIK